MPCRWLYCGDKKKVSSTYTPKGKTVATSTPQLNAQKSKVNAATSSHGKKAELDWAYSLKDSFETSSSGSGNSNDSNNAFQNWGQLSETGTRGFTPHNETHLSQTSHHGGATISNHGPTVSKHGNNVANYNFYKAGDGGTKSFYNEAYRNADAPHGQNKMAGRIVHPSQYDPNENPQQHHWQRPDYGGGGLYAEVIDTCKQYFCKMYCQQPQVPRKQDACDCDSSSEDETSSCSSDSSSSCSCSSEEEDCLCQSYASCDCNSKPSCCCSSPKKAERLPFGLLLPRIGDFIRGQMTSMMNYNYPERYANQRCSPFQNQSAMERIKVLLPPELRNLVQLTDGPEVQITLKMKAEDCAIQQNTSVETGKCGNCMGRNNNNDPYSGNAIVPQCCQQQQPQCCPSPQQSFRSYAHSNSYSDKACGCGGGGIERTPIPNKHDVGVGSHAAISITSSHQSNDNYNHHPNKHDIGVGSNTASASVVSSSHQSNYNPHHREHQTSTTQTQEHHKEREIDIWIQNGENKSKNDERHPKFYPLYDDF